MEKQDIGCDHCKVIFSRYIKYIVFNKKHGHKNYCSKRCQHESRVTSSVHKCSYCSTSLIRQPSAKKSKSRVSDRYFCNRSCAASYNNSFYKTGNNHPNYTLGRAYRKKALAHYPHKCVKCDYSRTEALQVDHIDGNRDNNDLSNLQILCPTHHWEKTIGLEDIDDNTKSMHKGMPARQ